MAAAGIIGGILSGISSIVGAVGASQAKKHQAAQAETDAKIGRIQADQIDAAYRDELNSTIANIQAIRASTGVGVDSPTTQAVEARNQKESDRNRRRDVASKRMQANQDENDARYLRSSAKFSLLGGVVGALPAFFGQ